MASDDVPKLEPAAIDELEPVIRSFDRGHLTPLGLRESVDVIARRHNFNTDVVSEWILSTSGGEVVASANAAVSVAPPSLPPASPNAWAEDGVLGGIRRRGKRMLITGLVIAVIGLLAT